MPYLMVNVVYIDSPNGVLSVVACCTCLDEVDYKCPYSVVLVNCVTQKVLFLRKGCLFIVEIV